MTAPSFAQGREALAAVPSIGRATGIDPGPLVAPEADATRSLYERYSRQIYNYCVHQLSSREEAEDAVQTTFMNAFRGLKRGIVPETEQAWLFKIAENVCLSRRRSSWRRGRVESPNDFEVLQEIVPSQHNRRADELIGLEGALEAMPENQRRAILLREWQGLSYREIAAELDCSQAAVETLIFRARRSLAHGLERPPAPAARRLRRAGQGLNFASLAAVLKSVVTGAAVKAVAVGIATGTLAVAALGHHDPAVKLRPAAASPRVTKHAQDVGTPPGPSVSAPVQLHAPASVAARSHGKLAAPSSDRTSHSTASVTAHAPAPVPTADVASVPAAPTDDLDAVPAATPSAGAKKSSAKADKPAPPANGNAGGNGKGKKGEVAHAAVLTPASVSVAPASSDPTSDTGTASHGNAGANSNAGGNGNGQAKGK